jgi:hypothetical protein
MLPTSELLSPALDHKASACRARQVRDAFVDLLSTAGPWTLDASLMKNFTLGGVQFF